MPKYVIHIGPHKSGSTYLQSSLSASRKHLERYGIHYPTSLRAPGATHHGALDARLRAGGPDADLARAFAEMNDGGHRLVLLSWENASILPEPALHYLRSLIGPRNDFELVYYCRRFAERIPSLWKQDIRNGRSQTLPEIVAATMRAPLRAQAYNAALAWARWAKVFGRHNLHLVSFNNLRDRKVDLFEHFAATFLNWPDAERSRLATVHKSPDTIDTEIARALNAIHVMRSGKPASEIFLSYLKLKKQLDFGPLLAAMERDTATMKLDDRAGALLAVYDAMLVYRDRLASPEYGSDLFVRAVSEVAYVRQNYLTAPGVVPALHGMYRAIRAASAPLATAAAAADGVAELEPADAG